MQKENKNVVVVSCPPCGENALEGQKGVLNKKISFTTPLPRYAGLPPQGGQRTAHGFTLIELLVVVLIIGILAAVAVPQYKVAVEKTKTVQLLTAVKALAEAEESYYLANGHYTTYVDNLDVSYQHDPTDNEAITLKNGASIFLGNNNKITGGNEHVAITIFYKHGAGQAATLHKPGMMICEAAQADAIGTRICKSLSNGVVVQPKYSGAGNKLSTSYLLRP